MMESDIIKNLKEENEYLRDDLDLLKKQLQILAKRLCNLREENLLLKARFEEQMR